MEETIAVPAGTERIDVAERLAAVALVREGRVFDLGTELANEMPLGPREAFGGFRVTPYRTPRSLIDPDFTEHDFSMELIQGSPHVGTHIDAPAHINSHGVGFGGRRIHDIYHDFGWTENGIDSVPPILTRGLLLDVPRVLGRDRLEDGFEVTVDHLRRCLDDAGLEVRRGDAVLVRTGKMADYDGDGTTYFAAGPGVGVEAALWLYEQGLAILGSDTSATEPYPFPDPNDTVHKALLVERGVYLVEILRLDEIAAAGVHEFLFACLPLKVRGGTGSWVRPIAVC